MNAESARAGAIADVDTLLALHDERFVRQAYLLVLGREADDDGLRNYLAQVRRGVDKAGIVAELALSGEGRKAPRRLAGLDALAHNPARAAPGRLRRLLERLVKPGLAATEMQLRALDNRLAVMADAQEQALAQLRDELRVLSNRLDVAMATSMSSANRIAELGLAPSDAERDRPDLLPAKARGIVRLIEQARASPGGGA